MTHTPLPPFAATAGSKTPKIVIVGEAWGADEELLKKPFVGESGKELMRMLGEAMPEVEPELHARINELTRYGLAWVHDREEWFEAAGIALTNVLALRPPDNKLGNLCENKKTVGADYSLPPLAKGKYLRPEYLPEVSRLLDEISRWSPNLVVCLGNTATWALLRATNISSIRGAVALSSYGSVHRQFKVLASYHPAGVLRQWAWRPIVVADLMKARKEAEFAEVRRPERRILINPTMTETCQWLAGRAGLIAADTETEGGQITCISFASSKGEALVVPFWDKTKPGWSYWQEHEEIEVWRQIATFMESEDVQFLFQNGLYDFQYITPMNIKIHRCTEDTMLLHHALYPELQKGLGFMGSIYTGEQSWKMMRRWKPDSEKRDE